jgi:hypothetical protein
MTDTAPLLLQLPDPCLLAVLQCLTDDPVSLFSAARAHSRLNQAAVVALSSIKVTVKNAQQLDYSLLPYLDKHGQHVNSLAVQGRCVSSVKLRELPANLQLTQLQLEGNLRVQLQPRDCYQGVLRPGLPLKQLRLGLACVLLDRERLSAALHELRALEHLSVSFNDKELVPGVLQELQHVTCLHMYCDIGYTRDPLSRTFLQPLQALTRLVDLEVGGSPSPPYTSDMLSGLCSLTHLALTVDSLDPAALAAKTQLQVLQLPCCSIAGGAAGVAQLLSELQPLTQLTHLDLRGSLRVVEGGNPPPAAFSALTASSKLQHLNISFCTLLADTWQHMFCADRPLPHLQSLVTDRVTMDGSSATPGSSLVSCCPGLLSLKMLYMQCSKELLAALTGLSRLTQLSLGAVDGVIESREVLEQLCPLTGLRHLVLGAPSNSQSLLLLTQLKQLTYFSSAEGYKTQRLYATIKVGFHGETVM